MVALGLSGGAALADPPAAAEPKAPEPKAPEPKAPEPKAKPMTTEPEAPKLEAKTPRPKGTLYVDTKPTGAKLSVGAEDVGKAPWSGPVEVGTHTVTAVMPGYLPQVQEVAVGAGEGRHLMLELVRSRTDKRRFYQRWTFWAATGGAAVGTSVLLYFLLKPDLDVRIDYP